MKYGKAYEFHKFSEEQMKVVHHAISKKDELHDGKIGSEHGAEFELDKKKRSSKIAWVHDPDLKIMLLEIMLKVNYTAAWNINISGCDTPQYTKYGKNDFYDWHMDQSPPVLKDNWLFIRKVSMSLNLTDPKDYTGGELELEYDKPNDDNKPRSVCLKGPKYHAVFFLSDTFHRVQPVKSGIRKSLVVWFTGSPYI